MDWLIYNLVGDVKTNYRYMVQCKIFKYVKNKMQESIVTNALLQTHDILDMNVILHPNVEDIAFVASTNHLEKLWILDAPTSIW